MMKSLKLTIVALLSLVAVGLQAQSATALRINEVMVTNESNFQDDYGTQSAWIEIFNTSFASVDMKGCYLTLDPTKPRTEWYCIPKSDVLTKIRPRQHALFWADGRPSRGTFHLNFTLDSATVNTIYLFNSNGIELIDSCVVPVLPADCSWARIQDGMVEWEIKGQSASSYVTPSTNNQTIDRNEKIETFKEKDADGIGMSITAMAVVFCGLILLYISFKGVGNVAMKLSKRNAMKAQKGASKAMKNESADLGVESGEIFAAIAMALHEAQEDVHDIEDTILTIQKVRRNYSPWSSKIYTLRHNPR